ncbi:MAG: hypothetical protein ACUVS4_03995, partial [Chloroflexaceae bacterium]
MTVPIRCCARHGPPPGLPLPGGGPGRLAALAAEPGAMQPPGLAPPGGGPGRLAALAAEPGAM